jgi:N-acetylmuramoyl-L-alanine amidase
MRPHTPKKSDPLRRCCLLIAALCFVMLLAGCACRHEYVGEVTKPATCVEEGEIRFTCRKCGDVTTEIIPAGGHSFSEWERVTAPSWSSKGEQTRVCSICGAVENEVIPRLATGAELLKPLPVKVKLPLTVCVDAGHGGMDGGAVGGELKESDLNLAIALYLRDYLKAAGLNVVMTREDDTFVGGSWQAGLRERARISNDSDAVLFVSVHANSYTDPSVKGMTTIRNKNRYPESDLLATLVQEETITATGAKDRGVSNDTGLVVLNHTNVPACLIEVGFLTCPEELELLSEENYRRVIAYGIANGIIRFLNER